VFGIVLLIAMGFALALQPPSPWLEIVAAGFGIGAGLTLGMLVPVIGLVAAVRLAKPDSPWARRLYPPGSPKRERVVQRHELHTRRYQRFQDQLAGAPAVEERPDG
jgi:hypothetical protein